MKTAVVPLTMIQTEKEVVLVSIEAGWGLRKRLSDMGLREGMKFKVLHSRGHGACIVHVGNTRLVLGHGMAYKMLVKEA
ncbi:ferrous iron transport protein A [Candidatus Omnitrophota bacterium]